MRRALLTRFLAGIAVLAGAWAAFTQQNKQAPQPMKVNKITDDLYELEQSGNGNVAIYLTNDGVILVDDKFEQNYDEIMANVKKLSDRPIKYVLNTHQHGDHTGSNAKMIADGVQIIIHKNARANMVKGKQPGVPQMAYADQFQLVLGGKEVLEGILKLDFDTVIPGHGALMKRADLEKFRAGFLSMQTRVRDMSRQNKSRDDISKMLQMDFGWGALNTGGLDRMIAELK
jgi:glyoxylase-like metal-dependent hydrolase (beta-lactamase superfamily II)